jgi:hypothetical protein
MTLPRGVAQPNQLAKQLNALSPLPLGVVKLRYTLDNDWSSDSAIFFWITLSDENASKTLLPRTMALSRLTILVGPNGPVIYTLLEDLRSTIDAPGGRRNGVAPTTAL